MKLQRAIIKSHLKILIIIYVSIKLSIFWEYPQSFLKIIKKQIDE
jgi:hypothetical protein